LTRTHATVVGGTISSSGLYTGPAAVPTPVAVNITATGAADPSKYTSATVSLVPPQAAPVVAIAVAPASTSVTIGATRQFTASVTGASNTAVNWTLSGTGCSGTACGTISSSGLYKAPATVPASPIVTITATGFVDSSQSGSAEVTIVPPQAAGYNLAWEDTFSTLSLCTTNVPGCNWYSPGIWSYPTGGVITDPGGVNLNWVSTQGSNYTNMTTASMNGAYFRAWTFGYIEISMAFNPATGNWPALWMLPIEWNHSAGANYSDSMPYGELDLFEWFSDHPSLGYSTVHVWENNADIANNSGTNTWQLPGGTALSNSNTYGVLWTPTTISWYFNNQLVETFSTTGAHFNEVFAGQQSYILILSEQAGCNGVYGVCSGNTQSSPLSMQVQWVHVYSPPAR
jgi:beta-glucanase (GH16 family)